MGFLRTLFWVLLAGTAVAFASNNWTTVPIALWGGLIADVNLPLLLLVTFMAGFLPMLLVYQTSRWRLRNRLASMEQTVAELRRPVAPVAVQPADPVIAPTIASEPVASTGPLPATPLDTSHASSASAASSATSGASAAASPASLASPGGE